MIKKRKKMDKKRRNALMLEKKIKLASYVEKTSEVDNETNKLSNEQSLNELKEELSAEASSEEINEELPESPKENVTQRYAVQINLVKTWFLMEFLYF